jgi:protein glucosyltransferase
MKPWVHYIPVATQGGNQGPSETDLLELIEFVGENDAIAQQIAQAGHDFVVEHLKMEDVTAYWARLLREYGKMQAWDITLLENEEGYKKIF